MSRKNTHRVAEMELLQPATKVTRVFKRQKKTGEEKLKGEENKENDISFSNKIITTNTQESEKKKPHQSKIQNDSKADKETKPKVKKAKRESVGKAKKATQDMEIQDSHLSDFLKQQQEFFKNVDDFELSIIEQQPEADSASQPQPEIEHRSDSPFLKDLIEQEFKKIEQEQKRVDMMPRPMTITEEVEEEPLDTLYFPEDNSFCAPPIQSPIQERKREEESNGMFVDADYEGLEEELDAELSYLKAPKRPSLPRPFLPCAIMRSVDPTESDFTQTPAAKTNSSYAYDEYKMVVGPVGTPISFEEFMKMQRSM